MTTMLIFMRGLAVCLAIGGAIWLNYLGRDGWAGWGWLIFVSLLLVGMGCRSD